MKIERISVKNMIAAQHAEISVKTPVVLVCGSNEAGKSSIYEGIIHAFTGKSTRISLKKEYKHLVNDNGEIGYCFIEYDGGKQACITLPNGTHEIKEQIHSALPYVLNPSLFTSLSEDDRHRFMIDISSIKMDMSGIKQKLIDRGMDAGKVEKILPFLRSGFDNAQKEAQENAKSAKTAWRTTTGETYGEKKAETWKAQKPEVDLEAIKAAEFLVADIDEKLQVENQKLGVLQSDFKAQQENVTEINNLRSMAEKMERIEAKLSLDRKELAIWTVKVEDAKRIAMGSTPENVSCKCTECDAELTWTGKELTKRKGDLHGDEEVAVKLPEYEKTLTMFRNAVTNGERDLASGRWAKEKLAEIENGSKEIISEERILQLKAGIDELKARKKITQITLDELKTNERLGNESEAKTKNAADYHVDVQSWDFIASALAPDGIPGEMLASALKPINDRLALTSKRTDWKPVTITDDMTIMYAGRPYGVASESAQWRINTMIAEAISYLSGLKIFMVDKFDLLDMQGRAQLIYWLEELAESKEIDTVILFGTMKALPSGLPGCMSAHWIESGVIGALEAA